MTNDSRIRLAIITTHPIQYYAPVFRLLHESLQIEIKVFYTWGKQAQDKYDPGFNKKIDWDIPLLEGYPYEWARNTSKNPGSHHFRGIINPDLIQQVYAYQPNAILIIGWAYHSHLKTIRYFKNKIPVLFRGDSTLLDEKPGIKSFARSILLKWVYKHIDHAFYVGSNSKAYFKKYGLTDAQLKLAPHAVDNQRFALSKPDEVKLLRQNLQIKDDDILILFAGKFENKKDPLLLLNSFSKLNNPNAKLLFVGNGELEQQLKEEAKGLANVHFMDFQNQSYMPVIYQACDIFCLPSKGPGETWGLTVNEAMACGKAILVSDKAGCAIDLVKPEVNGIIFKAGSSVDLQNKLAYLANKAKPELKQMGEASTKIIDNWSFKLQVESIISVLNKI